MNCYQENHYKDSSPENTVANIKRILEEIGVETEEQIIPKSSADTHSLRVTIRGTNLGSNGKGVSPVLAKASAYAEFMERLQNDIMTVFARYPKHKKGFYSFPDERFFTAREVAGMDNAFMEYFFSSRNMQEKTLEEKAEYIRKYRKMDYFMNGGLDSYEARPFYSVRNRKIEYLPYYLYLYYYSSNGMSAGNTPEEALVQGFSEIIERHVQEKIYLEKPALPDIPDEYIRRYPYIWERVQKIRELPGIRMFMKDCSFGGKYPVAALVLVNENTGQYGVKLGCHPDFGVAMERTITEASQGGDFSDYAGRSVLDFTNKNVDSTWNIYNSYKFGMAPFPYEIFGPESAWSFTPVRDVSNMGNREILKMILDEFLQAGYEVFIRDVSYTGFPSYHIIVPGISEIYREHSQLYEKVLNTKIYLTRFLNYPETIDERIAKLLKGSLDFWADSQIENSMKQHYSVYPDFTFPGEEISYGWLYMSVMCCMYLEQYGEAAQRLQALVILGERLKSSEQKWYIAVRQYAEARGQGLSHVQSMKFLQMFFDKDICEKLERIFKVKDTIFTEQYPRFDYLGLDGTVDRRPCEYNTWLEVKDRMREYMLEHPLKQERIGELLFS